MKSLLRTAVEEAKATQRRLSANPVLLLNEIETLRTRLSQLEREVYKIGMPKPSDLTKSQAAMVRVIQECVAEAFHLDLNTMLGASREARFAWPRMVSMALSREFTTLGTQEIAGLHSRLDHGSVIYASHAVRRRASAVCPQGRIDENNVNSCRLLIRARLQLEQAA